jgi:hypothetical protein
MADDWKRRSDLKSCAISRTKRWNGSLLFGLLADESQAAVSLCDIPDQELSGLLVATDLTESDGTRLISVRLLDATGRGSGFASGLGGELLSWGLATWR